MNKSSFLMSLPLFMIICFLDDSPFLSGIRYNLKNRVLLEIQYLLKLKLPNLICLGEVVLIRQNGKNSASGSKVLDPCTSCYVHVWGSYLLFLHLIYHIYKIEVSFAPQWLWDPWTDWSFWKGGRMVTLFHTTSLQYRTHSSLPIFHVYALIKCQTKSS